MDKFKFLIILIIVFIFAEGAGLIYFAHRSQKLKKTKPVIVEKIVRPAGGYKEKYDQLALKYDALEKDRNNLLVQTKRMAKERGEVTSAKAALERVKNVKKLFDSEKKEFEKEKLELMAQLDKYKIDMPAVEEENNTLKASLESLKTELNAARSEDVVKTYEGKMAALTGQYQKEIGVMEKKCDELEAEIKVARKEAQKIERNFRKSEKRVGGLRASLDEYKEKYKKAEKINKELVREVREIPKKFSEMARQNKNLIKETAQMHYNLGVFYTNNLEYKRAIAEFAKAVEINPEDSHSHFNLGYIYAEYPVDRKKAIEHFRHYIRYAGRNDKDVDWVKKYLLTWETFEGMKRGAVR
jgi:tetratricopeptide (TPR) repeat protein